MNLMGLPPASGTTFVGEQLPDQDIFRRSKGVKASPRPTVEAAELAL
jgi:hypothetical protein